MNEPSSLFGAGFIGSRYVEMYPTDIGRIMERSELWAEEMRVLYFISTVHNYNVGINPYLDIDTNLTHLVRVLHENDGGLDEFNFISSWFVYGKTDELPAKEISPCFPNGFYSATKLCAEHLVQSFCQMEETDFRILRLPNVLGVGDKKASLKKNALQYITKCIVRGIPVQVYDGNENVIRDFMHVDDVCRAINLVINSKQTTNSTINVGNGIPCVMKDLIDYVLKKTGGHVDYIEPPEFHKIVQTQKMWMDNSKLESLGFEPQYTVYDALDELIEFYGTNRDS